MSVPVALDAAATVDHVGVIPRPDGHEVSVPPPYAPSLATDRADRREERKQGRRKPNLRNGKIGNTF